MSSSLLQVCLLNLGTYTELQTTSFIESPGVVCSDFVNHNRIQVLRIPLLLLACSQDWTCNLQITLCYYFLHTVTDFYIYWFNDDYYLSQSLENWTIQGIDL